MLLALGRESCCTSTVKLLSCPLDTSRQPRSQGFSLIVWQSLENEVGQQQPHSHGLLFDDFENGGDDPGHEVEAAGFEL